MIKYINEDEALDLIHEHNDELYAPDDEDIITYLLENMPSADVVEVVRCKDCKYYKESIHFAPDKMCYKYKDNKGHKIGYIKSDNDFCSYGERKAE